MENKLENIMEDTNISNHEKIYQGDAVLVLAINEIIREVSYHCIERVWKLNLYLLFY